MGEMTGSFDPKSLIVKYKEWEFDDASRVRLVILSRRRRIWPASERLLQLAAQILHFAALRSG